MKIISRKEAMALGLKVAQLCDCSGRGVGELG
jgi:hypothetical protein